MPDIDKNEEIKKENNIEEKNNDINEEKTKESETKNEKDGKIIKNIGSVGNFILIAFIILIIGTGFLTYYLVNNARKELENDSEALLNTIPENVSQPEEPDTIANMIDTVISNVTDQNSVQATNNIDASSIKFLNEELIVLYKGLVLKTDKMEVKELQYIDNTSDLKENYIITYYNYENFAFKDAKLGTLSTQIFDGAVKVENVGKVAISEKYNAIPREINVVNSIPTVISENNNKIKDYDLSKTIIADLDGNGTEEYILILANKTTGYSKIMLVDSKGNKVDDLAYIEKSKWDTATNEEYYLSISNVEVIDIDNDGIMEILIELPKSDGASTKISLLKYKGGELAGDRNIECSMINK